MKNKYIGKIYGMCWLIRLFKNLLQSKINYYFEKKKYKI